MKSVLSGKLVQVALFKSLVYCPLDWKMHLLKTTMLPSTDGVTLLLKLVMYHLHNERARYMVVNTLDFLEISCKRDVLYGNAVVLPNCIAINKQR